MKNSQYQGTIQGQSVKVFRDSGCEKTAVNSKFVSDHCYTGKSIEAKGINGPVYLPTANVYIDCERYVGNVEVMVIDDLDQHVLLGTELDSWDDLHSPQETVTPNILVLTRGPKTTTGRQGNCGPR